MRARFGTGGGLTPPPLPLPQGEGGLTESPPSPCGLGLRSRPRSGGGARRALLAVTLGLTLSGCAAALEDLPPPQQAWRPAGINDANIAAMAAHPDDLVHGRGAAGSIGPEAVLPVQQLWKGQRGLLPPTQYSSDAASAAAGGNQGAPSAAPPPPPGPSE